MFSWPDKRSFSLACAVARIASTLAKATARSGQMSSSAPAQTKVSRARRLTSFGIDALTEIAEIAESFRASRLHDRLRGLATHALDGRQRVTDRALSRLEQHA